MDSLDSRHKCNTCYGVGAMGTLYEQLSLRERVEIDIGRRKGLSMQAIGQMLGRSASTISRELGRNGRPTRHWRGSYDGERADGLAARRRRWDARHKLARQPALAITVRDYLAMGWSPEIIAGRLARQHGCTIISPESIYRFVYHRSAQKDYWHRLLPRAKSRRGPLGRRGGSPLRTFKDRVPLSQRPAQAQGRTVPGHWEADLMAFSRYGQAVLVTHERSSRQLVIERLPSKAAQGVVDRLIALFQSLPKALCQTVTFDNVLGQEEKRCIGKQVSMREFAPAVGSSSIQAASTELEGLSAIANKGSSGLAVALTVLKTRCRSRWKTQALSTGSRRAPSRLHGEGFSHLAPFPQRRDGSRHRF